MTTQISVNICHGSAYVSNEDKDRAEAAALKVLGSVEPETAYAEFQRQWDVLDDCDRMTGLAKLWVEAGRAADVALTEGWRNPAGAYCEISA